MIGKREFSDYNRGLMTPNGSIHATQDKSIVRQLLQELPESGNRTMEEESAPSIVPTRKTCLIVDWMAVVHELFAVTSPKTCEEFGTSYTALIDRKAKKYDQVRVIFDNYTKESSLKDVTRE